MSLIPSTTTLGRAALPAGFLAKVISHQQRIASPFARLARHSTSQGWSRLKLASPNMITLPWQRRPWKSPRRCRHERRGSPQVRAEVSGQMRTDLRLVSQDGTTFEHVDDWAIGGVSARALLHSSGRASRSRRAPGTRCLSKPRQSAQRSFLQDRRARSRVGLGNRPQPNSLR